MNSSPTDMLKLLASGIRPDGGAQRTAVKPAAEEAGFASLLAKVRNGAVASDQPLTVSTAAQGGLDADQLSRLALAADAAEAAGASRILALIDGKAVTIDVPARTVNAVADEASLGLVRDIDAVVSVPKQVDPESIRGMFQPASGGKLPDHAVIPGLAAWRNSSLTGLLGAPG